MDQYSSAKGRFNILVPADPKLSKQEIFTGDGKKVTQYRVSASDANFAVFAAYYDYSSGMSYRLEQGRDSIVRTTGTLLNERRINLEEGHPGLELNISAKRPEGIEFLVRVRIYDVDRRVYVLQFIIPRSEDNAESRGNSFEVF